MAEPQKTLKTPFLPYSLQNQKIKKIDIPSHEFIEIEIQIEYGGGMVETLSGTIRDLQNTSNKKRIFNPLGVCTMSVI